MKNAGLKFEGVCVYAENKNQVILKISETLIVIFEIWMKNTGLKFEGVCVYAENKNQVIRQISKIS